MKASIIIPVYNAEKTIKETLKALEEQEGIAGRDFEVVCVDDGSTDRTIKAIKAFRKVRLIRQNHKGPAVARNLGARKAIGEILVFIDSDCAPEKNWLKEMLEPFKKKEIKGVQGAYKSRQKSLIARFVQTEVEERYEHMKNYRFIDWIGTYSGAYRKKDFLEVKGFDEKFPIASGEDPDLSFRMAKKGKKLVFNPKAIVYHLHPESLTHYLKVKFFRAFYRIRLYGKHADKMKQDTYTTHTLKIKIVLLYLIALTFALSFIGFIFQILTALLILLFALTLIPASWYMLKKSLVLGLIAPVLLTLRSIAFASGLVAGLIWGRKQ
ncbi:glycosyltransferase [archaeon]|nr:glycosyltransferase [archaeon]